METRETRVSSGRESLLRLGESTLILLHASSSLLPHLLFLFQPLLISLPLTSSSRERRSHSHRDKFAERERSIRTLFESRRITGVTGVSANYFRSKNFLLRTVGPCCFFGINASPDSVKPLNGANETRVGYTSRFSLVINLVAFLHTLSRIFQYVLSILRC